MPATTRTTRPLTAEQIKTLAWRTATLAAAALVVACDAAPALDSFTAPPAAGITSASTDAPSAGPDTTGDEASESTTDADPDADDTADESSTGAGTSDADPDADPCGNGRLDPGETCDDGEDNDVNGWCMPAGTVLYGGVDRSCKPALCGDGFTNGAEECDDQPESGSDHDACTNACKLASCGDGKVAPELRLRLMEQGVRLYMVDGDHFSMFQEPGASQMAAQIAARD